MRQATSVFVLAVTTILSGSSSVLAQRGGQGDRGMGPGTGMMRYDPATEVTVTGTVEEVKELDCAECPRGTQGTHITLQTSDQSLDVHLGPTSYLADQEFTVGKNDRIEVTGSKIKEEDAEVILARQVKKGDQTVTLRDAQGVPAWSRGMQRRQ
jgi:hypothetical protein